jgi:hypothetical protein
VYASSIVGSTRYLDGTYTVPVKFELNTSGLASTGATTYNVAVRLLSDDSVAVASRNLVDVATKSDDPITILAAALITFTFTVNDASADMAAEANSTPKPLAARSDSEDNAASAKALNVAVDVRSDSPDIDAPAEAITNNADVKSDSPESEAEPSNDRP